MAASSNPVILVNVLVPVLIDNCFLQLARQADDKRKEKSIEISSDEDDDTDSDDDEDDDDDDDDAAKQKEKKKKEKKMKAKLEKAKSKRNGNEDALAREWVRFFYVMIEPVEPRTRLVDPYVSFAKMLFRYAVRSRENGDYK